MKDTDHNRTNCPNCGAPLTPDGHCEYCDTTVPSDPPKSEIVMTADSIRIMFG